MILRTDRLTKTYGTQRALDDLSISVATGEIFGLLGPNGSGKSTALRLLLGFLQPTAGSATIAGHDCWKDSVAVRRHVAYLPGELRLYENMTGQQLVRFLDRLRERTDSETIGRLAKRFDIALERPIAELSSGMKRKVALLLVLLPKAPLLILDEPTNTLDPTMRDELLAQLRSARNDGQAVLFSSHVLSEVERVCDRVGILKAGRLVHVQTMNELQRIRRIEVRFQNGCPESPKLAGLEVVNRGPKQIGWEYAGSLAPLLEWLALHDVDELRMEPLGLAGIYRRFHGAPD